MYKDENNFVKGQKIKIILIIIMFILCLINI